MRKNELIAALQAIEGDPIIVLSRDEEGNGYNTLADVETLGYDDGEGWQPDQGEGETWDDLPDGYVKAICLWP